ncbi:MAG: C45 family autoproteolytic acyltransferase/hydrolase [Kiritimatiellaeota bacterium]|nr:C45 family autoproteolytic acyltransferase/hydrolase [Kiritimatiellota bacterium]
MNTFPEITGSARESGRQIGRLFGAQIAALTRDIVIQPERLKKFRRMLEKTAAWWLEEAEGIAETAGIVPDKLLAANCLPQKPNKYYLGGCTSFLVMPDRSQTGIPLLLKIRDEAPLPQVVGTKHIDGTFRYIFGTNLNNLGIAHFLNERGLAGANNTGSPIISGINDLGFNDCHIMRLVAEKAADCREALEVIREIVAAGFCSNAGFERGMIFLFADKTGQGLLVENTSATVVFKFVRRGAFIYTNHFLLPEGRRLINRRRNREVPMKSSRIRYRRSRQLLRATGPAINPEDLGRFSQDTENQPYSLCNGSDIFPWRTISAFIHELDALKPRCRVCNGLPTETPYLPLACADKGRRC